ncbi:hypothetical protein [Paraferrimonas sedimenticola]|uniref:Uncharacterized protein n=1 Tax=Paraferrimonas sedimenticola TaxID=375674 RepID=A0AA37RY61_9GAMM|nr:hypothetical protein [Paraferrimonas sedimenticola]GLP97398.1 hypothetical protein GCM10007895_27050 [Paraferrimonas sedimenticola]
MIHWYAVFSTKNKNAHRVILFLVALFVLACFYQVAANEAIEFLAALLPVPVLVWFFGRASQFKRKYHIRES